MSETAIRAYRKDRPATVADVARVADVSTAAVSLYFSNRKEHASRVGAEARERIRAAIDELGYVQNKTARHLRRQSTERVCILLSKLGIPFADRIVEDLGAMARRHGILPIVLAGSSVEEVQEILREVDAGLADGVIAELNLLSEQEVDEALAGLARPCLVIHPTAKPRNHSTISSDIVGALLQAFADLLAKGHRHFAYIPNRGSAANDRVSALRNHIAPSEPVRILELAEADTRSAAAQRAQEIAILADRPSVVLVESDYTAVTLIEEFTRLSLQVPNEIAIVGCGNAEEGFFCNPRLTTIGPDWTSLTEAGQHLFDRLDPLQNARPRNFITPWTYFPRESA